MSYIWSEGFTFWNSVIKIIQVFLHMDSAGPE